MRPGALPSCPAPPPLRPPERATLTLAPAGESRWEEEDEDDEDDGGDGGNRGPGSGDDSPAGQRRIPGIDMSSLD